MTIAIIDCGAGNLHSVRKAFAAQLSSNDLVVATDAEEVRKASHIVLPGVGAFADCMQGLNKLDGMREVLEEKVQHGSTPFLGICVGMQMLFECGHEFGMHEGLGWFKGEVEKITPSDSTLKIPHMGWNALQDLQKHPILEGITAGEHVYFVHSYAARHTQKNNVLAQVEYGGKIVSIIGREHIVGTQFHPEKSQRVGLRLIKNFLEM